MRFVRALEAAYDGPIPPAALRHARMLDARAEKLAAPYVPPDLPPRPPDPRRFKRPLAAAMAEVMVLRTAAEGGCTEADLAAAGFTQAELQLHGETARALARRLTAPRRPA